MTTTPTDQVLGQVLDLIVSQYDRDKIKATVHALERYVATSPRPWRYYNSGPLPDWDHDGVTICPGVRQNPEDGSWEGFVYVMTPEWAPTFTVTVSFVDHDDIDTDGVIECAVELVRGASGMSPR